MKLVESVKSKDLIPGHMSYLECERCGYLDAFVLHDADNTVFGDDTVVVPLGSRLLAVRERLDQTSDGQGMIGFECACGNDTRISDAEQHHEPENGWNTDVTAKETKKIAQAIKDCGTHEADFEQNSRKTRYETFTMKDAR